MSFSKKLIGFFRSACRKILHFDEQILVFLGLAILLKYSVIVISKFVFINSPVWDLMIICCGYPKKIAEPVAVLYLVVYALQKIFEKKIG